MVSEKKRAGKKGSGDNFRGRDKTDGIWAYVKVDCNIAWFLPLWDRIDYNISCVFNIPYKAIIG